MIVIPGLGGGYSADGYEQYVNDLINDAVGGYETLGAYVSPGSQRAARAEERAERIRVLEEEAAARAPRGTIVELPSSSSSSVFEEALNRGFVNTGSGTKDQSIFDDLVRVKEFPSKSPSLPSTDLPTGDLPSTPLPGGSGGGSGGGIISGTDVLADTRRVLGTLVRSRAARVLGGTLEVLGPFIDQVGLWDEYLYGENRRAEARRARRGKGPTRRRRTALEAARASVGIPNEVLGREPRIEAPRIKVPRPAPLPRYADESPIFGALPASEPDPFSRDMSRPVATRGVGTGVRETRQSIDEQLRRTPMPAPVQIGEPWWQRLLNQGREFLSTVDVQSFVEDFLQPRTSGPTTNLDGPGSTSPRQSSQPRPTTRTSPTESTSAPPSEPRCPSSDPCMRRAADKRREQRKKQKECGDFKTITREVRICQPSR